MYGNAKSRLHMVMQTAVYVSMFNLDYTLWIGAETTFRIRSSTTSALLGKGILEPDQAFQKNTGFLFVPIYIVLLLSHRCPPFAFVIKSKRESINST